MSSSSATTNSGHKANQTGQAFESFVENILRDNGYAEFQGPKKQLFATRKIIDGRQYAKQVACGEGLYGTKRRCDFLVFNKNRFPEDLIIECRWQQKSGSVDEKLPYLLLCIQKTALPTIIVIDGKGFRKEAMEWLKGNVGKTEALLGVYSMEEFSSEVNDGFLQDN
jgi:hypothetical protein